MTSSGSDARTFRRGPRVAAGALPRARCRRRSGAVRETRRQPPADSRSGTNWEDLPNDAATVAARPPAGMLLCRMMSVPETQHARAVDERPPARQAGGRCRREGRRAGGMAGRCGRAVRRRWQNGSARPRAPASGRRDALRFSHPPSTGLCIGLPTSLRGRSVSRAGCISSGLCVECGRREATHLLRGACSPGGVCSSFSDALGRTKRPATGASTRPRAGGNGPSQDAVTGGSA